jgi:hypothetical protein
MYGRAYESHGPAAKKNLSYLLEMWSFEYKEAHFWAQQKHFKAMAGLKCLLSLNIEDT